MIKATRDLSPTIYSEEFDEHYHSVHGARTESQHVFIKTGLNQVDGTDISILELGFGTGLNVLETWKVQESRKIKITSLELYPLSSHQVEQYVEQKAFMPDEKAFLHRIHAISWGIWAEVSPGFMLFKAQVDFRKFDTDNNYDLIYFDAFSPNKQPELWTEEIFRHMYELLKMNGVLTTYCSKSIVRKAMVAAGFKVEKVPGPPGKREILRGIKLN